MIVNTDRYYDRAIALALENCCIESSVIITDGRILQYNEICWLLLACLSYFHKVLVCHFKDITVSFLIHYRLSCTLFLPQKAYETTTLISEKMTNVADITGVNNCAKSLLFFSTRKEA